MIWIGAGTVDLIFLAHSTDFSTILTLHPLSLLAHDLLARDQFLAASTSRLFITPFIYVVLIPFTPKAGDADTVKV